MLHTNNPEIAKLLLDGNFGLERETLRVTENGKMSHKPHPFDTSKNNIVRDFCENQIEINTHVHTSVSAVLEELTNLHNEIWQTLNNLPEKELIWLSSNPPRIFGEEDIPIARFHGLLSDKTEYREYLSHKYGRYKMALSGIHFNYSFSGTLLRKNYEIESREAVSKGQETPLYRQYSDKLYLNLAENFLRYGWIVVTLTAASPLIDSSYFDSSIDYSTIFSGMSSVRCSEFGYWNFFVPTLDYSDVPNYVNSLEHYVKRKLISAPSELYYPIRLKPKGLNRLDTLLKSGINHIEVRSIDLNPLTDIGIDIRDIEFLQLLLVYLASIPVQKLDAKDQVQAIQNFKTAAHFDIELSHITYPMGRTLTLKAAVKELLTKIKDFYNGIDTGKSSQINSIIEYQLNKIIDPKNHNYAQIVKRSFANNYVDKILEQSLKNRSKHV